MYAVAQKVLRRKRVRLLKCSIQDYKSDTCFDMLISHMCAQAVEDLDLFLKAVVSHMHKTSVFVFAIPHPCFYNSYKSLFPPDEYDYMRDIRKMISFTITRDPGSAISGIPYNHRPLSTYFSHLRDHCLCVRGFDEIIPEPGIQALYGSSWEVPRYCAFQAQRCSGMTA